MDLCIFDVYNLRTYICATVTYMIPFLVDAIRRFPQLPSLSEDLLGSVVFIALCQLLLNISFSRRRDRTNQDMAAELLAPGSSLSEGTRSRYYHTLARLEPSFQPLLTWIDPAASPEERQAVDVNALCADVVVWLRAKSRDRKKFHLVHEENINYAFARNMLQQRPAGIAINLLAALLAGACLLSDVSMPAWLTNETAILCLIVHLVAVPLYLAGVSQSSVTATAERYAYALLEVIDILEA